MARLRRTAAGVLALLLLAALPASAAPAAAATAGSTDRVGGATRVHTAVEVSRAGWTASGSAVVATARAFPDALAGTALAAALDAPLLLTEPGRLPGELAAELVRLGVGEVVVLGGEAAVSAGVARALEALPTAPRVRRIGGRDRYETAALAVGAALDVDPAAPLPTEVALASGSDFPDALVSGALPSPRGRVPVLLSHRDRLPAPTRTLLASLEPERVLLAGGTAVLAGSVAEEVAGLGSRPERLSGPDRFSTGVAAARAALERAGPEPRPLVVATGSAFPDALAAGALVARLDGVLLLAPPGTLTSGLDGFLRAERGRFSHALVVGGRAALSPHVRSEVSAALDGGPRPRATVTSPGGFRGTAGPLPAAVAERMEGLSWRSGCPVGLDDLALLRMPHRDFSGGAAQGVMVVHRAYEREVLEVFAALYDADFRIAGMRLVDDYEADDDASMAANNTHAFNCRRVGGDPGRPWSEHAYGRAIDINPVQNPYVAGGRVSPPAGAAYLDRADVRPGMIVRPGPVVTAFEGIGWGWGGDWTSVKDYHHFSSTGR